MKRRVNSTSEKKRLIRLKNSFNFRDLGGYETADGRITKWGKVFRSGNLSLIEEDDIDTIYQLGIKKICDLRDDVETNKYPDPLMEGISWIHTPIVSDPRMVKQIGDIQEATQYDYSVPGHYLISLNRKMVTFTSSFKQVFDAILDTPDHPILFHCMAGKDRTGAVSALILTALGVTREKIIEDYLYTNISLKEMKEHFDKIGIGSKQTEQVNQALIDAMVEARIEYIHAFFDEIELKYGDVENYLKSKIGLTDDDFETMKKHLLE